MHNRMRELRTAAALSQEACADALGVTRQTIISIEKGHFDPRLSLAFRISELFGEPVDAIFGPRAAELGHSPSADD